jgi:peroxiredoxin
MGFTRHACRSILLRMSDESSPFKTLLPLAQIAFIAAAAMVVFFFVSVTREGESRRRCGALCLLRPNYAGASMTAPAFALPDMNGNTVSLESYRGKVIVLNFWTKTCNPCMQEMPTVSDLAKILKPRTDAALITVSTDDGPDAVRDTLKTILHEDPSFPVLFDPDSKIVNGKFGTTLFPETWIIDKRGVIRARFDGSREWSSAMVVELVDELRADSYCPVEIRESKATGEAAKVCEGFGGS